MPSLVRSTAALLLLGVAACASQLPSETPLGVGPLARMRPPSEPSGPPVTMPGAAGPMQIETDDEGDGDGDDTRTVTSASSPAEVPDAGVSSTTDAGPAPAASAPASAPATGTPDFVGNYAGKDSSIFKLDGAVIRQDDDPKALMTVKKSGSGLSVIIVASNTGDALCTLSGEQKGDTVTLATGQACPEPKNPFSPGKVTSGKGKLRGKEFSLDITFEANIEVEGEQHKGSIDYHFEGTRR